MTATAHVVPDESSPVSPSADTPRSTGIWSGLALTIAVWFSSRIIVSASWGPARNPFSFAPYQWIHADSRNYLGIAAHGRTFGRCGSAAFPDNALIRLWHLKWCGTAGWLPGYPWLMAAVHWLGLSFPDAGVLVSWVATAVTIFVVWFGWGRDLSPIRAYAVLLLFAVFPGSVYNFAVFPTSVALACMVGAILAATRERFFTMALLMTMAGLTYPSSWFAALGLIGGVVLIALPLGASTVVRRALWGVAGLSSLLILGVLDQIAFGQADAYWVLTSNAADSLSATAHEFYLIFVSRNTIEQTRMGRHAAPLYSIQVVIAILVPIASVVVVARDWFRDRRDAVNVYPAMVGLVLLLALVFTNNTWNRGVVLAAPCVVCLRRVPLPLLWGIVVVTGVTTALISRSFFNGSFY